MALDVDDFLTEAAKRILVNTALDARHLSALIVSLQIRREKSVAELSEEFSLAPETTKALLDQIDGQAADNIDLGFNLLSSFVKAKKARDESQARRDSLADQVEAFVARNPENPDSAKLAELAKDLRNTDVEL